MKTEIIENMIQEIPGDIINLNNLPVGYIDLYRWLSTDNIEIDIGFGRGYFLVSRAKSVPSATLIGIEVKKKWLMKAYRRARREGIKNIVFVWLDAKLFIPKLKPDESVTRFFINFPDPWWKKRHQKRKLLTPGFATELYRLLRPGGEILLQTDVDYRAEEYLKLFEGMGLKNIAGEKRYFPENPFGIYSHREKKCNELGEPVFRLYFRKEG